MKRKIISLLLCLVMALSLIPTVAFGVDGEATDPLTTNGFYTDNGWKAGEDGTITTTDGLTLSKTAESVGDNTYRINLTVTTTQTTTTVTTSSDAATVLVIDCSGSMAWCSNTHRHTQACYENKTPCTREDNPGHWKQGLFGYYYHKADTSCEWVRDGYYVLSCGQGQHTHNGVSGGQPCGGTGDPRITSAKKAAMAFIESYKDSSAKRLVAVVSFAGDADSSGWFNVSTEEGYNNAIAAINGLEADGATNLDAGLSAANSLMAEDAVSAIVKDNKNVIALTDGVPTQSATNGNGEYGSKDINDDTASTAKTLKGTVNALYTICFAASGEVCYQGGPSVSEFLSTKIASSAETAKTVEDGTDLTLTFTNISSTITTGLTGDGWTVEDPMPDYISVDGTLDGYDATSKTYTWKLSNPAVSGEGDTKTYTYTTSYTVKIAPNGKDADGNPLSEDTFYPTNEVTTLHYQDANGDPQKADFPVPGVKVKLPDPTPTPGSLTINKVFEGLPENTCPESVMFTVTGPNSYNQTVTMTANDQWTKTLTDLTPGDYTVTETSADVTGYTYTTNNTGTSSNDGKTATVTVNANADSAAIVNFINTYEEESTPPAEVVPVNIPVTKTVSAKVGSTLPKDLPNFTFKALLNGKPVGELKLSDMDSIGNNQYQGTLTANIPAADFANNNNMVTLTIKEDKGIDTKWKYDTKEYTVTVHMVIERAVTKDPLVIMLGDKAADSVSFENVYSYKYTPAPKPTTPAKPVTSVKTGDMGVALYAGLAILSMTGSAGVILRRRKNDK